MKKISILLTALLFTFTVINAQSPNEFKYQAVLRDASGDIMANETVNVTISILETSAIGSSVFAETHSVTTTAQGLINLNIGSINDMSVVDWSADAYFVEISVNGTVMGTSQLLSVPYALHAKTVENDAVDDADHDTTNELQDLNLNGTVLEISNGTNADLATLQDGIGTDNQNLTGATLTGTSLEIEIENGTSTSVDLATLQDGTGTDDQELTLTGTTLEIENGNNITFTGWDTDASDDFDGDYNSLSNQPTIPANVSDLSDFDTSGATNGQILEFNGTEWTPNSTIWTKSGDNIYYDTGLVGIGVSSPTASLDIYDNIGNPFLKLVSEDNVYTQWISDRANVDDYLIGIDGGNNRFVFANTTTGNYPLVLQNDNVGIGTLTPINGKLQIENDGSLPQLYFEVPGEMAFSWQADRISGNNTLIETISGIKARKIEAIGAGTTLRNTFYYDYNSGNEIASVVFDENGNVGIGTLTPSAKLQAQTTSGSQPTAYFVTSSTNGQTDVLEVVAGGNSNPTNLVHIVDSTGDSPNLLKVDGPQANEFIIKNNGFVGVGVANPLRNLHIAGALSLIRFEDTDNNQIFDMGISSNGTAWSIYDKTHEKARLIINSASGNVGVGEINPNAKLEVLADASNVGLIVKANATSPGHIQEWKNGSGTTLNYVPNNGGIVFENLNTPNKGIRFMADQTSGVSGAYGNFQPINNNTTGGLSLLPKGTGNGLLSIFGTDALANPANNRVLAISTNSSNFNIWPRNYGTETAKPFYIYKPGNAQDAAISIATNGNVGINTATPEAPLHISDFMKLEPRSSAPSSPTKGMIYYDDTDDKIKVFTGSTWENLN